MATQTTNYGLTKPSGDELIDLSVFNDNFDIIDSQMKSNADAAAESPLSAYPVGSIYMSVSSTSPSTLFGGTWERIEGKFLLCATDNESSGASQAAGNTGGEATVTLTSSQSGVPAHSHGLNSHKHSIGAHSHTIPEHGHGNNISYSVNSSGYVANGITGGSHAHTTLRRNNSGSDNGYGEVSDYGKCKWESDYVNVSTHTHNLPNHTHTLTKSGGVSNKAAFNTNNSTAFDSGAASGNTANNTASNASESHNNMPPYLAVYVWKRTA